MLVPETSTIRTKIQLNSNNFHSKIGLQYDRIRKWLYWKFITNVDRMTDVSLQFLSNYKRNYLTSRFVMQLKLMANDGTIKFQVEDAGGECVFIPRLRNTSTICLSTQCGCSVGCRFCETGRSYYFKDLSAKEIIMQLLVLGKLLNRTNYFSNGRVNSLVLMGMGEPLLNYNNTITAVQTIIRNNSFGISRKAITISTSGVAAVMNKMIGKFFTSLAVSLHSINRTVRNGLVPLNKIIGIDAVLQSCRKYTAKFHRVPITFEYCAINNVNVFEADAVNLQRTLSTINCKLNVIPLNINSSNKAFSIPNASKLRSFCQMLTILGVKTTIREVRGNDISASCGQLAVGKLFYD